MTSFDQASPQEQEKRVLELARKSLTHWQLSGELSLLKLRENAVYCLTTTVGKKYALRVHRANYHSDAALQSEFAWIDQLQAAGIGVPTAIPTTGGALFTTVSTDNIDAARQVDLWEWINGRQVGSVEEGLGNNQDQVRLIFQTIGQVAARMHNQSSQWSLPTDFKRHAWDCDGLVGDEPLWGRFWELNALTDAQRKLTLQARTQLHDDLTRYGQAATHYSLIHADLVPENILVDDNSVQVIDFDDAGFGWHLFELATALYFIQSDPCYPIAQEALIEGYRQHRSLSQQQLDHLPMFLAARSLTYLGWVHTRQSTQTARELTPYLIELCCQTLTRYLQPSE